MKYDEDYEVLDDSFTRATSYIGDNPEIWEDEPSGAFKPQCNLILKTTGQGRLEYSIDKYLDGSKFKTSESTIIVSEPTTTIGETFPLNSLGVGTFNIEIKNFKALTSSPVKVTSSQIEKGKGTVRIYKVPKISGGSNLGEKNIPFSITANLSSDSRKTTRVTATLNSKQIYSNLSNLSSHNIEITKEMFKELLFNKSYSITVKAEDSVDSNKNSTTTFTFMKVGNPLDVNIEDKDFGKITKKPTIQYTITKGTEVTSYEKINGETIRSFKPSIGKKYDFQITDEKWKELTPNKLTTATLEVKDEYEQTVKRTFKFTKLSDPPILNIEDKDFGKISSKPIIEYSLTKGENVTIREKIEDKEVRNFKATIGETYQFEMSDEDWQGFSPNKVITATIEAEDGNGQVITKTFTFEKIITRIEIKGKTPTKTDDKVTKVLLRPILRSMEGVKTVNIYACNNGLDNEPTWEDISENSLLHNVSFLENDSKTSEEWAFNLKIVIEREEGYDGEIILDALGGAFE